VMCLLHSCWLSRKSKTVEPHGTPLASEAVQLP
jgi:hypothetical protein